jgi:hypothetical protein
MGSFGAIIPVLGLNLGFPGTVTRLADRVSASRSVLATSTLNINFGDPVVIDTATDTYRSVADLIAASGTFTAAKFAGVALREVKANLNYTTLGSGTPTTFGFYSPNDMAGALERGSALVLCRVGTPVSQGPVFVRIALNGAFPAGVIGGFEAVADGANTVSLATVGVVFRTSQLDSNSCAEITLLNRVAA